MMTSSRTKPRFSKQTADQSFVGQREQRPAPEGAACRVCDASTKGRVMGILLKECQGCYSWKSCSDGCEDSNFSGQKRIRVLPGYQCGEAHCRISAGIPRGRYHVQCWRLSRGNLQRCQTDTESKPACSTPPHSQSHCRRLPSCAKRRTWLLIWKGHN